MIDKLLWRWLFGFTMLSFFGIGEGPSGPEKQEFNLLRDIGSFAGQTGTKDVGEASRFWSDLLSGDPQKIAQILGPEISSINKQGQQAKKTAAEFGNRSGGTNASMQMIDDNTRSAIRQMIANLTGGAASSLGSMGQSLLGTSVGAGEAGFSAATTLHDQNLKKWNDIFSSIAKTAAGFAGLPAVPGTGLLGAMNG